MILNDDTSKVRGYFKLEVIDEVTNEVKETYEHHNLITDKARLTIMNSMGGFENKFINKFVLGTQGHRTGDLTTPKTASDGFKSTRTQLFSEELGDFTYSINFTPTVANADAIVVEDDIDAGSSITIKVADTTLSYVIEVAAAAGNKLSQAEYTEAALYTGDAIFAMRCFPVRIKDYTTKFRITWNITF